MSPKTSVLQIKVTLQHVEPPVWRRLHVPAGLLLRRLHETIQASMGWLSQHLYEFRIGERRYGVPPPDDLQFGRRIANDANLKLSSLVDEGIRQFNYVYDFGDDWWHEITIEDVRPGEPGIDFPILIEGGRRCPPEDCGGPPGYEAFLEAMSDVNHPEHAEVLEWFGELYDPDDIERHIIDAQLSRIARSRRGGLKARGRPRKPH